MRTLLVGSGLQAGDHHLVWQLKKLGPFNRSEYDTYSFKLASTLQPDVIVFLPGMTHWVCRCRWAKRLAACAPATRIVLIVPDEIYEATHKELVSGDLGKVKQIVFIMPTSATVAGAMEAIHAAPLRPVDGEWTDEEATEDEDRVHAYGAAPPAAVCGPAFAPPSPFQGHRTFGLSS